MPTALVIGARNLGFAVVKRLLSDDWTVAGAARSPETLAKVRSAAAEALDVDVTDQASVLAALQDLGARHGRVDLAVNAASPYGDSRSGPFGGGPLAHAAPTSFDDWATSPTRGAFGFLSACASFMSAQGGPSTIVQVTGGSARRGMPGRGPWAAGAFGVRALTQAPASELREQQIHVALLIVDAVIDRSGGDDTATADPSSLADAVAYLAGQSPRAMTHELQVTPAGDNWSP